MRRTFLDQAPAEYRLDLVFGYVSDSEILWRMKGYLDCLRALKTYGPPDPKFVEYLVEKTGEQAP